MMKGCIDRLKLRKIIIRQGGSCCVLSFDGSGKDDAGWSWPMTCFLLGVDGVDLVVCVIIR